MKKFISTTAAAILALIIFLPQNAISQVPQKMSYQMVVRDASGVLVSEGPVGVYVTLINDSTENNVYAEIHNGTTNVNGLLSLQIGTGNVQEGNFSLIDWSSGAFSILTEVDPEGGTNYTAVQASSELLSVPYALFAENAGSPWITSFDDIFNDNDGNVGIGVTSPIFKLDLQDNSPNEAVLRIRNTDFDGKSGIQFYSHDGAFPSMELGYGNPNSNNPAEAYISGNEGLVFISQNQRRMTMTLTGEIGIGTQIPTAKLHVLGDFKLQDGSEGLGKVLTSDGFGLASWTAPSNAVGQWSPTGDDISNSNIGNVGIGTSSPIRKLDVNGGMNVTNEIRIQSWANFYTSDSSPRLYAGNGGVFNPGDLILQAKTNNSSGLGDIHLATGANNVISTKLLVKSDGDVGIGTTDPQSKLDVRGAIRTNNGDAIWDRMELYSDGFSSFIKTFGDDEGLIIESEGEKIKLEAANVYCEGKFWAREVEVTLAAFPDYVFDADYELMSLTEVESFIAEHGHLPNVPSADEVEENGLGLGKMNKILLEKVEEMTLHLIAQQKMLDAQMELIISLQNQDK